MAKVDTTPVIAFVNKSGLASIKGSVEAFRPTLKEIVDEFNAMDIGALETSELKRLIEAPETVVKEKCVALLGEAPSFGPFKMKKEAIVDQIELPSLARLHEAIAKFKQKLRTQSGTLAVLSSFEIINKELAVNEAVVESRLKGCITYAVTDKEKELVQAYKKFIEAYKELDIIVKRTGYTGLHNFKHLALVDIDTDGEYVINPHLYNSLTNRY